MERNLLLTLIEAIVLGGILAAFILPAFSPSEETNETSQIVHQA